MPCVFAAYQPGQTDALAELQFCTLPPVVSLQKLVAVGSIKHRRADSLYIADAEAFCLHYGDIFTGGTYNNLQTGPVDLCGINYYSPAQAAAILQRVRACAAPGRSALQVWLLQAQSCNGFYILGI